MSPSEHSKLLGDRLQQYHNQMKPKLAIPFLCIGFSHDPAKSGQAVVCLDDKCQVSQAIELLEQVITLLRERA